MYWMKEYPRFRSFAGLRGFADERNARRFVRTGLTGLRQELNREHVKERLWNRFQNDPLNRLSPPWGNTIQGAVDVTAIPVYSDEYSEKTYNGKYGTDVVKLQAVTDNWAAINWWSGPHWGAGRGTSDVNLFRRHHPPGLASGSLLADLGYIGGPACCVVGCKRKRGQRRLETREERAFNKFHGFFRARIEAAFAYLKRFDVLGSRYRGALVRHHPDEPTLLELAIDVILLLDGWMSLERGFKLRETVNFHVPRPLIVKLARRIPPRLDGVRAPPTVQAGTGRYCYISLGWCSYTGAPRIDAVIDRDVACCGCERGGQLIECDVCNHSWHRACLRPVPTDAMWQSLTTPLPAGAPSGATVRLACCRVCVAEVRALRLAGTVITAPANA